MKWVLIAAMLTGQPVYEDEKTCRIAAAEIQKIYYQEAAVCIPMPTADLLATEREQELDMMFEKFFNLIDQIKKLEQEALDTHMNR